MFDERRVGSCLKRVNCADANEVELKGKLLFKDKVKVVYNYSLPCWQSDRFIVSPVGRGIVLS